MKHYAEGGNHSILQPAAEWEALRQALRQEQNQALLAREETESFRHQLQKLKNYAKESQNEAREAKEKIARLQQQLEEKERTSNSQSVQNSSLVGQFQRQTSILETENANYKIRLEKLAALLREKEKKILELQQYEMSFRKVNEQKSFHDSTVQKHLDTIHSLENQLEETTKQFEESSQKEEELKAVIAELRQQQESNQQELHTFQTQIDALTEANESFKKDIDLALSQQRELTAFLQKVEISSLEELHVNLNAMKEQVKIAEEQTAIKHALQEERDTLHQSLIQAKNAQEDAEARLKTAHQHLAKKVKETALLNDHVQAHEERMHDLQSQLNVARARTAEMQQGLDAHALQESRLQEQIQHSAQSMEALSNRWEEKYFKIYEKWQEGEVRIREMKKLEEKHSQMQSLLAGISGVFGVPIGGNSFPTPSTNQETTRFVAESEGLSKTLISPSLKEVPQIVQTSSFASRIAPSDPFEQEMSVEGSTSGFYGQLAQPHLHSDADDGTHLTPPDSIHHVDEEKVLNGPYQSLFDMPHQVKRPKNTLFD